MVHNEHVWYELAHYELGNCEYVHWEYVDYEHVCCQHMDYQHQFCDYFDFAHVYKCCVLRCAIMHYLEKVEKVDVLNFENSNMHD